jgi:carbamoyltransferase
MVRRAATKEAAMDEGPLVLGVNRTQDASVCLMRGSTLRWAIQKERLTRIKHHWGRLGDIADHYAARLPGLNQPIDVLVECYSSDAEIDNLSAYQRELAATLTLAPDARRARISHHLAHLYSAFHPSPFDHAAVMVIDGQGSAVADFTESWPRPEGVPGDWREVSSFYLADREHATCIGKQLWDRDERRLCGLGMFYFMLTQAIFPGEGNEGKVMGLAPHGDPHALRMPPLEVSGARVHMPEPWRELLTERGRFRYAGASHTSFRDVANLAAAGQLAFEEALLSVARWLHARTGVDQLCFAGGTALNCSVNERLLRETPFRQLFIPPAPGDAGTALGCAVYGLTELAGQQCGFRWRDDYLGPPPDPADIEATLRQAPDLQIVRLDDTAALCARVAGLLYEGNIVALYQGRSEFGPRALGHRSILADPREGRMRDAINAQVKQREWFRPLAPVVLRERAAEFFELSHPAPFMQYAVAVTPNGADRLRATTHIDRSARLQTVGPDDDQLLRRLLLAFEARSGLPVLLNTSFNRRDEPIVETPAEALATFRATPIDALAMPPFLVRKRGALA